MQKPNITPPLDAKTLQTRAPVDTNGRRIPSVHTPSPTAQTRLIAATATFTPNAWRHRWRKLESSYRHAAFFVYQHHHPHPHGAALTQQRCAVQPARSPFVLPATP